MRNYSSFGTVFVVALLALFAAPQAQAQGPSDFEVGMAVYRLGSAFDVPTATMERFEADRMSTEDRSGHLSVEYSTADADLCRFVGVMALAVVVTASESSGDKSGTVTCNRHRVEVTGSNYGMTGTLIQYRRSTGDVVYRRTIDL